jgi:hypothetical protein
VGDDPTKYILLRGDVSNQSGIRLRHRALLFVDGGFRFAR